VVSGLRDGRMAVGRIGMMIEKRLTYQVGIKYLSTTKKLLLRLDILIRRILDV
jgi:hypothetical protein